MKFKGMINELSTVKAGKAKIISVTDGEDFIKKGSVKNPRPEHLNNIRKVTLQVVHVAYNYNDLVRRSLERSGVENVGEVWEETPCRYSVKYSKNGVVRSSLNEDSDTMYLRYYLAKNNYKEELYVNDQDKVIEITKEDKELWFKCKSDSKKQVEAGVKNPISIRNLKLENLFYFQKGQAIYNRLSEKLMKLLNLEYVE